MIDAKTKQRWLTIRPEGSAADRGFTLLEVLVTIAILGVIVVPLAQTLIAGFKVTAQVQDNVSASVNRDLLASRFTNDVAEVDAAGYSTGANFCTTAAAVSTDKLILSLNSSKLNSSGTRIVKRVSYWTAGSGRQLSIVRRQCDGVTPGSPNATGVETVVAADIGGDEFATRANTIYENIATSSGGVTFCDEYRCSMQIASVPPRSTTITAQRRVFGAGVPLQVGRLYSSSKSDNASTGVAYETFNAAGATQGTERTFPNLLSLPPGLDGSDSLSVSFEVKQVTTGMWLANDHSGFTKTQNQKDAQGGDLQVVADPPSATNGQAWTLPLTMGATKAANAGGEYQVFTSLKETDQPAKKYGGANGFPLWVDWKPTDSIFVKAGAPGCGDPVVAGGSRGTADANGVPMPVCTLAQGLAASVTLAKPNILVNNAVTYTEDIAFTTSTYTNNRAIVGGLNDSWLRLAPVPATGVGLSKLTGATTGTGLLINGRTGIRIRQMDIRSGTVAGAAKGTSYYGARVISSPATNNSWAWFERSLVTADAGVDGADATTPGTDRGESCWGKDAVQKSTSTNNGIRNIGSNCSGSQQPMSSVRRGGDGGAGGGGGDFFNSGGDGTPGQRGAGTTADGGNGGTRGRGGYCVTPHPEPSGGGGGGAGGVGGNGGLAGLWSSVSVAATASATGFTPGKGLPGETGSDGRGGGGAGGAGGTYCAGAASGGAGATAGEGGQAGTGGEGGQGGGGSFGLYLGALSTTNMGLMRIDNTTLKGNQGGTGGAGARGGNGGKGGQGGYGSKIQDKGGDASGGGGGGGGSGGGGGAGGPAGPSLGLYSNTDYGTMTRTAVTYVSSQRAGGPGGAAGAKGTYGAGGGANTDCQFFGIGGLEGWVCGAFGTNYVNYPGYKGADADINPLAAHGAGATGMQFPNCRAWKSGIGGTCDVP